MIAESFSMALVEFTAAYSGKPIAVDRELIGEVRDLTHEIGRHIGKTLIRHKANRRVKWLVDDRYEEVMAKIRYAEEMAVLAGAKRK